MNVYDKINELFDYQQSLQDEMSESYYSTEFILVQIHKIYT